MPTPGYTLTATLQDLVGAAGANAKLRLTLANFGLSVPKITGTAVLAELTIDITPAGGGAISKVIYGNDQISPAGTFYCVQLIDAEGVVAWAADYQFNGSGGDLSGVPPYIPPPPTPTGNREVEVTSVAGIAVFDASLGSNISTLFHIVLHENVGFGNATFINMIPGVPYQVIIEQDDTGGWTFDWPDNVGGAVVPVNPVPNGITAQAFVGISDASEIEPGPSMMATGGAVYLP